MNTQVRTLDELTEDLERVTLAQETTDAAIAALGPNGDENDLAELRAKFDEQGKEVAWIKEAIDRKTRMRELETEVPRPNDAEKKAPAGTLGRIGDEPLTYRKEGVREPDGTYRSFFADAYWAGKGDVAAQTRLARHSKEMAVNGVTADQRAITSSSGGPGLVPTQYFLDELATFARASRPFADAIGGQPLPESGVSFSIPRVTTGATTAVQSEGSGVNDSSPVTDYITLALNTVAGKVDSSRQLIDRSNPLADVIVGQDLAADYAKQLDTQLLSQATNGITVLSGTNGVTYTQATPTAATLYPKVADGIQQVHTNRFAAPSLIVMHPRRWASLLAALDSSNRPLVLPDAMGAVQIFNAMAGESAVVPQGLVGLLQGLPVVVDPNITTTAGAGTNQDVIIVTRREDQVLAEQGAPTVAVYEEVLSANLQIRILAFGYFAFTFARYPKATSIISGTGLVTPSF